MARFCHFWRITPQQFWDLSIDEYFAMLRYMRKYQAHQDSITSGRGRLRR